MELEKDLKKKGKTKKKETKETKNTKPKVKRKRKSTKKATKKKTKIEINYIENLSLKKIKIDGKKNIVDLKKRKEIITKIRAKSKSYLKSNVMKKEDCFLTIDMSKKKPGFCIMRNDGKILNAVSLPGSTINKPLEILLLVEAMIKKYKPSIAIFEATFSRFVKAADVLARYQGLVYSLLIRYDIKAYKASNLTVKAAFGVKKKDDLFDVIIKLYDIEGLNFDDFNDETDAIAIGLAYLLKKDIIKKFD